MGNFNDRVFVLFTIFVITKTLSIQNFFSPIPYLLVESKTMALIMKLQTMKITAVTMVSCLAVNCIPNNMFLPSADSVTMESSFRGNKNLVVLMTNTKILFKNVNGV